MKSPPHFSVLVLVFPTQCRHVLNSADRVCSPLSLQPSSSSQTTQCGRPSSSYCLCFVTRRPALVHPALTIFPSSLHEPSHSNPSPIPSLVYVILCGLSLPIPTPLLLHNLSPGIHLPYSDHIPVFPEFGLITVTCRRTSESLSTNNST